MKTPTRQRKAGWANRLRKIPTPPKKAGWGTLAKISQRPGSAGWATPPRSGYLFNMSAVT
jgi:hypothetical protein